MIELIQITIAVSMGLIVAELFLWTEETKAERRERQRVQRVVKDKYPPTY
jgi:hypothetical protein